MRLAIDAGHGGRDPGASSHGVLEKRITLAVSLLVADILRDAGRCVRLTRANDVSRSLAARAGIANRYGAHRFVSIHCNAALNRDAHGIETWFYNGSPRGRRLAAGVQAGMLQEFPDARDRGIKEGNFAVLRLTKMPAVLVELGFLTNTAERRMLVKPSWQMRAAAAIARGVLAPLEAAA